MASIIEKLHYGNIDLQASGHCSETLSRRLPTR